MTRAVAVVLVVPALAPWSSDTELRVEAAVAGAGAGLILWLRRKRLPELPTR